jgi:Arv1-like family
MLSPGRVAVHYLLQRQRPPHAMRSPPHPPPLTAQDKCKKFADKYIEHDFVVLFIDIILIKPQVYRHLLYNRLGTADDRLNVPPQSPPFAPLS